MRVLLVSCYELGHQPLHVASAAAFLQAAGHEVRALDLGIEEMDDERLGWGGLVAVAVPMHTAMRLADEVVRRVRALRGDGVQVALFGLYAPLCAAALPDGAVDHAVGGEFEEELVRIAGGAPSGRTVILDRLQFPVPVRDVLPPVERYARLLVDGEERVAGYVEATRGCVHRCRHCPVPAVYDGRIRVVQVETVAEDAARLHAVGVRHLTFGDPDFLNAPPHALAVARAVHARCPDLTFDITTKVEHILRHPHVIGELAGLGLLFAVTAAESTSERVLEVLRKGHTHVQTLEALRVLRAHGVEPRPSLLPFTPWSTLPDVLAILDFILDEDLLDSVDPVQLGIRLLVPQGSLLLEAPEMQAHLEGYDPATFTWRWRHPDPAVDELQRRFSAAVATATDAGRSPRETHAEIRRLAAAAALEAGIAWRGADLPVPLQATGRPRLSEPWFCCAEPTDAQLRAVTTGALRAVPVARG